MSKLSTSVTRKALKLDNKVKAINLSDGGKSCLAVAKEMGQRLKWMVAQSPNATNILFGRPKAALN